MSDKPYLSASDLLAGIMGKAEDYALQDVGTVRIRALTVAEVQDLYRTHKGDDMALMVGSIAVGMTDPVLSPEQAQGLMQAAAGPVTNLAKRIMEISGMTANVGE